MTELNEISKPEVGPEEANKGKTRAIIAAVIAVVLLIGTIVGLVILAQKGNAEVAAQVREHTQRDSSFPE
jgi:hypothetical protein